MVVPHGVSSNKKKSKEKTFTKKLNKIFYKNFE
jgi:hypothetical protein